MNLGSKTYTLKSIFLKKLNNLRSAVLEQILI